MNLLNIFDKYEPMMASNCNPNSPKTIIGIIFKPALFVPKSCSQTLIHSTRSSPCLSRKSATRKREKDEPEDQKVIPDGEVKPETKDEDSGNESEGEGKSKSGIAGEEADVRDVIYNLESLGILTNMILDWWWDLLNHHGID